MENKDKLNIFLVFAFGATLCLVLTPHIAEAKTLPQKNYTINGTEYNYSEQIERDIILLGKNIYEKEKAKIKKGEPTNIKQKNRLILTTKPPTIPERQIYFYKEILRTYGADTADKEKTKHKNTPQVLIIAEQIGIDLTKIKTYNKVRAEDPLTRTSIKKYEDKKLAKTQ